MTEYSDKFAVIGAGFCGLGVCSAFEKNGISYDCLEADSKLGGNWYHGVYETVHIISSRKTTQYSDYPMPSSYPDFPSAAQMLAYLNAYADHYKIRPHIEFETKVSQVAPVENDCWELTLENGETRIYGGVVVANGHHWDCRIPQYPGNFTGEFIHSKQYKTPDMLKNKRVLVIGGGNSACDIASEAGRFALSSHISMRRGYWIMPKTMFGVPSVELMQLWMPLWLQRLYLQTLLRIFVGSYEKYGLQKPDHKIFEHHPTINSELLYYIRQGTIQPHPDIKSYQNKTVEFVDGTQAEFDLIVAATGYKLSIPVVKPGVIEWKNGMPQLISGMISPRYKNLYIFGTGQARYGAGPLITAGAESLCLLIKEQKRLKHPVGAIFAKMGQKPARTNIIGPEDILRGTRRTRQIAPRLPALEKLLLG
jgi:cation diffusion facilitator CzcD-associated flavoprotein CzcO